MYRVALNAAIIFAALSVIAGAFGAHSLKNSLPDDLLYLLDSYETAVRYQFYHAIALAISALIHDKYPSKWVRRASWFFIVGIILFSGSIFTLVALKATSSIGLGGLGILTPIGGSILIIGWILLFLGINFDKFKGK